MQPTKEQWVRIAADLERMFCPVYLRCDGYVVGLMMERVDTNRLEIGVSVNGWRIKGEWLPMGDRPMSEEARRFWRPSKRQRWSRKHLLAMEKIYGKRECRKRGYYEPVIYPWPTWRRPGPLIRHLKKHNQSIEVIDYEAYKAGIEAVRNQESIDG